MFNPRFDGLIDLLTTISDPVWFTITEDRVEESDEDLQYGMYEIKSEKPNTFHVRYVDKDDHGDVGWSDWCFGGKTFQEAENVAKATALNIKILNTYEKTYVKGSV